MRIPELSGGRDYLPEPLYQFVMYRGGKKRLPPRKQRESAKYFLIADVCACGVIRGSIIFIADILSADWA